MLKIRIDPRSGSSYFPKGVRREGFVGVVEGLVSALTLTLIRTGSKLADIEASLEIVLQDIYLRRKQEVDGGEKVEGVVRNLPVGQSEGESGEKHPVFVIYTRGWLHKVTGFSKGYLSRVATGKLPLSRAFVERVCFKMGFPESELFLHDKSEAEVR